MKTPTFWEGVLIALLASIIGSIGFFGLSSLLSEDFSIRLMISGLTIAYIIYLLCRSHESVGRITILLVLLTILAVLWLFYPPVSLFLGIHLLAIWLIRSLYFYASLLSSLVDFGLSIFSITAALWACHQMGSMFFSLWCFFLVQALFVAIPTGKKPPEQRKNSVPDSHNDFNRAYQAAESAVRKLSSFN